MPAIRSDAGFSLVEVTLAMGIVAFGFLAIFGLIPTGLNVMRQAIDTTTSSAINQRIMNDAQQTDFTQLVQAAGTGTLRYFDDQGIEVPMAGALYQARTLVTPTTTLPSNASTTDLATVTIQIVNNPTRRTVNTDVGTNLWKDSHFTINTYSGFVSRAPMNKPPPTLQARGFTLVELLVSMVLVVLLLIFLVSVTDSTRRTWASANAKIEEFRGAREGFETITRRLSDATLNTYYDYDDAVTPTKYIRQSELRFLSGPGIAQLNATGAPQTASPKRPTHAVFFQAPLGFVTSTTAMNLPQLLNTWGYFVEFSDDSDTRPAFLDNLPKPPLKRTRFRLMELMEPSEALTIYTKTSGYDGSTPPKANCDIYMDADWFTSPLGKTGPRQYRPVAENIVALVILPKLAPGDQTAGGFSDASLAPGYLYDTTGKGMSSTITNKKLNPKNQLPPVMQVTMVAVSESSYSRIRPDTPVTPTMPDFYTNSPFTDAATYTTDLQTLTKTLGSAKLAYRVFTTNVSIKSAKWSAD